MSETVELGFVEKRAAWKLRSKFFPSKVGGYPAWLRLNNLPDRSELLCQECKKPLVFLLQVYAPIIENEDSFHRTIFIFMCRNVECHKSSTKQNFVVYRSQLPRKNDFYSYEPPEMNEKSSSKPSAEQCQAICAVCGCSASLKCEKCSLKDYCCEDHKNNDWEWNHVNSCSGVIKDSGTKQKKVINHFLLPEFELVTETEELPEELPEKSEEMRMKEFENYLQSSTTREFQDVPVGDLEDMKKDKAFIKFNKRVKLEPEQVLRYQRAGEPLWASGENVPAEGVIPMCICGAKRVFEFQVMPQLLHYLSLDYDLDWGTLIIYTCSQSCKHGTETYVKEVLWKQDISS